MVRPGGVLDEMVSGIMSVKAQKATQLTPVGTESAQPRLPRTPAPFPNDDPQEVVEQSIAVLQQQIEHLQGVVTALLMLAGKTGEQAINIVKPTVLTATVKSDPEAEAMGDRLARLQAEAQDHAFRKDETVAVPLADMDVPLDGPEPWQCPIHANEDIILTTSPKGRKYHACQIDGCKEFER